ncbi:MAG: hypothetical protein JWO31_4226 [Phycisphaerales bacterium]|nr:hypothetical protein [Phycisphaerales bacterium]
MAKKPTDSPGGFPVMSFASRAAWEAWLGRNHDGSPGVWIKFAKKGSGLPSVNYAEALDVALCLGWIGGQVKGLDGSHDLHRFTPRTPRSKWSKVNCGKVARLLEAGRMRPAGLRQVDAAKADGRWDAAYDPPSRATVPDDLRAALDANGKAKEFFGTLDSRNRYAVVYRVHDAKRPETRARRIGTFVAMLARGEKVHP